MKKLIAWIRNNPFMVTAQFAHFAWGYYVPAKLAQHGVAPIIGVHVSAGLWLAKESAESLGIAFWEPKQTWASSGIDYLFFILGILSYLL
jgi:hypothetical protein